MTGPHSSGGGSANGRYGSPARSTISFAPRGAATTTSWPARRTARAKGTSG
jgi:hypothetical protein